MNKEKLLAKKIVNYSLKVKKDDRVLITYQNISSIKFVKMIIQEINNVGSIAFTIYDDVSLSAYLKEITTSKRIELIKKYKEFELNNFDVFINIKYNFNDYENKNIDPKITKKILDETYSTHNKLVNERRWLLLNYPSVVDSYKAKMTYDDFYNYSLDVMNVDYEKISKDLEPLKKLMEKNK